MADVIDAVKEKAANDPQLRSVLKRVEKGSADFKDTADYSVRFSHLLGGTLSENVLDIPADIREAAAEELLKYGYDDINTVLADVQTAIDIRSGIHIRPQKADFPLERVRQFSHSLIDPTVEDSVIKRRARSGSETITKSFHDSFIKKNATFRNDAGLSCYIIREGSGCCKWCSDVAGKYKFGTQPSDIFRRHDNCDCTIIYDGQVLRGKKNADGSRSKTWEEVPDADGNYEPKVLSETDARAAEQRNLQQYRGLTNDENSGKINKKIHFYSINEESDNIYTEEEIEAEMQKSPIGRYISECVENDGYLIEMDYDINAPIDECGFNDGKNISINAINHNDASEIAETIIHEVAHDKFSWTDTQEGEINCRIYEYLHSHKTISNETIKEIVEFVKENYSYFPEGDLYGY